MQTNYKNSSNKSGVYKIINLINNKIYIGSAKNFSVRFSQHVKSLENNKHQNKHLQNAFNEYGTNNFLFEVIEVLEELNKEQRFQVEQEYIDQYLENWDQCYNFKKQTTQRERSCFSKTPEESRLKKSKASKLVMSDENRRKQISLKMKDIRSKHHPMLGQKNNWGHHTEKSKIKMSFAKTKKIKLINKISGEKIICFGAKEVAAKLNIKPCVIYKILINSYNNKTNFHISYE